MLRTLADFKHLKRCEQPRVTVVDYQHKGCSLWFYRPSSGDRLLADAVMQSLFFKAKSCCCSRMLFCHTSSLKNQSVKSSSGAKFHHSDSWSLVSCRLTHSGQEARLWVNVWVILCHFKSDAESCWLT